MVSYSVDLNPLYKRKLYRKRAGCCRHVRVQYCSLISCMLFIMNITKGPHLYNVYKIRIPVILSNMKSCENDVIIKSNYPWLSILDISAPCVPYQSSTTYYYTCKLFINLNQMRTNLIQTSMPLSCNCSQTH